MTYRLEMMGQKKYAGLTVLNGKGDRHFNGVVKCHDGELVKPLAWKKPKRIFVNSMSDTFHRDVPFKFIDKMFAVMALCPQHTFQILTKRPERAAKYLTQLMGPNGYPGANNWLEDAPRASCMIAKEGQAIRRKMFNDPYLPCFPWPLPNVWIGTSVENQAAADERIPHLLKCPAAVRFLSVEPLLGPMEIPPGFNGPRRMGDGLMHYWAQPFIDWVIIGGESGPGARPMNIEWARSIVGQCKAAGVAVFVKQLGAVPQKPFGAQAQLELNAFAGSREQGRMHTLVLKDKKGGTPDEWPEDLRIREMPAEAR